MQCGRCGRQAGAPGGKSLSVTKDTVERYSIRAGHEHASIFIRCWERKANVDTPHEGVYYCGEIAINSSFGSWGNTWTACADPFKRFLTQVEFDYIFGKFMGHALERFDGPASVTEMFAGIVRERRQNSLTKSEAREARDALYEERSEAEECEYSFGSAMFRAGQNIKTSNPMRDVFADPSGWPRCHHYDRQAEGFWKTIWPEFVGALRAEIDQPATAET